MPTTRKHRRASLRMTGYCLVTLFAFSAWLPPAFVSAQAQDGGAPAEDPNVKKGREIAAKLFGTMQKVNSACSLAFGLAKAAVTLDPFAVVDAFFEYLLKGDGPTPDIAVRQARDEILAELRKTREEDLVARSNSLVSRFAELTDDPDNMLVNDRLANYLEHRTH